MTCRRAPARKGGRIIAPRPHPPTQSRDARRDPTAIPAEPMPSSPTKTLETFPNPAPERDYRIHMEIPEFTCLCPKTGQPDFATLRLDYVADRAVRRAEEPQALHLVVPRRRRVPRGGHQPHPRRPRRGDRAALHAPDGEVRTCAAASSPPSSPSIASAAGSRSRRWTCRRSSRPPDVRSKPMNPHLARLQPYPFEKLRALLARRAAEPRALAPINLSIGEPKHPTPAFIKDALADDLDGLARYPATLGTPTLREAIARWLARRYGVARARSRRRRCCRSTARARRCSPSRRR